MVGGKRVGGTGRERWKGCEEERGDVWESVGVGMAESCGASDCRGVWKMFVRVWCERECACESEGESGDDNAWVCKWERTSGSARGGMTTHIMIILTLPTVYTRINLGADRACTS